MHPKRNRNGVLDLEPNLTAFVDVIFQLVLFFVFALEFLNPEGHLGPFLPRGGEGPARGPERAVELHLAWLPEHGGRVICRCPLYFPPDGSPPVEDFLFPSDPGTRLVRGDDGVERTTTDTILVDPDDGRPHRFACDYGVPDFTEIERYIQARRETLRSLGVGLPSVIIHSDPEVPWQVPVSVFDICARLGIEEVSLGSGVGD